MSAMRCQFHAGNTDALRRHQKSRHHGVVIEPVEASKDDESRSRSGTPSSLKGKEKATNLPVHTYQGAPTSTGPSSYYRSHTATTTPYIPPRPTQLGLPTSSVRTDTTWPEYPPAWQNGTLPPSVGTIGYTMSMYYPSPHYRPHTNGYHTGRSPPPQPPPPPLYHSTGPSPSTTSRNPSTQPPNSSSLSESSVTCIDSELEGGSELTAADVVAAVQAVLLQAETVEKAKKQREKEEKERFLRGQGGESDAVGIGQSGDDEDEMNALRGYEPMEHILTEDGEPMLNPAELLTQESLAESPPP
ncbi:hypothetical protein BDN70DRAFT_68062 [Pholiota conissans]|uniref:Uncharacterized protein n=1 Tax=Pholiota conissans TaxID=109636 RepID=A0A9P5Z0J4_9AGAR|nr:hypothetical protein BDN70DRAFT_68062 [Pholiota conissans]